MLSNALDDECTGRSPCRDCKWHLQGVDKNQCVEKCKRLAAYRNGEPWEGLDVPFLYSGKEIVEMEETEEKEINIEHVSRHSPAKSDPTSNVQHQTTTQFRGLLNKEAGGKCLIDTCETEGNLIRGLCIKHYQAWRKGYIKHPILGKFTVFQAKSHQRSEAKKEEIYGQPSTQSSAAPGKPEADESILKSMADAAAQEVIAEIKAASKAGLILNLDNYPKIKQELDYLAEKYFVTPEHVIIDMLGWAMAARKDSGENK